MKILPEGRNAEHYSSSSPRVLVEWEPATEMIFLFMIQVGTLE
jgi:hypothetical protein